MKKYASILFDLDHTLWDYEANSKETLIELFDTFRLNEKGITSLAFLFETFTRVNNRLWSLYDRGLVGQDTIRTERFHKVFTEAGLEDYKLSLKFSEKYLTELPKKKNLLPHALEVLGYLHEKYPLTIVTNGFNEIQAGKLNSSGIHHYFKHIITSQRAGARKPSRKIFDFALTESGFKCDHCIMIGDNLVTDIGGARSAGIDTVYFNPSGTEHKEEVSFEIRSLKELQGIL